mgnify:CR=1 FL=1
MEQEQLQEKNQVSESKYILQHDRPNCIGCAACEAVAPDFWEMYGDGKSDIKGAANKENGWQEQEIDEKNFAENKDAADSCPVNVIHITNRKTGERLI